MHRSTKKGPFETGGDGRLGGAVSPSVRWTRTHLLPAMQIIWATFALDHSQSPAMKCVIMHHPVLG